MDTSDLVPLIELLDDNIDDLEEALSPLIESALSDTAGKLPLLDKAQLYVLVTYAIESILFSYLRLNSVNAKEHFVFRELTRVKQYFEKLKNVEFVSTSKQSMTVDKAAAQRFIKHALAATNPSNPNPGGKDEKTKFATHIKFEQASNKRKKDDRNRIVAHTQASPSGSSESRQSASGATAPNSEVLPVVQESIGKQYWQEKKRFKKQRRGVKGTESGNKESVVLSTSTQPSPMDDSAGKGSSRRRKIEKRARRAAAKQY